MPTSQSHYNFTVYHHNRNRTRSRFLNSNNNSWALAVDLGQRPQKVHRLRRYEMDQEMVRSS